MKDQPEPRTRPAGLGPDTRRRRQSHTTIPEGNGLATSGFVVALIGACLALIPFVGTVSWIISPVGLILSAVGLVIALRRPGHPKRGLAIAGIILSLVGIALCVYYTSSFVNTFAHPNAAPVAPAPAPEQPPARYGTPQTSDEMTVTVAKPKRSTNALGSQFCTKVTYRNTGASPHPYNLFDWKFRTAAGTETSASIPYDAGNGLNSGDLNPGGTVSGQVCGDNTVRDVAAVIYTPGLLSSSGLVWANQS